MSSRRTLILIGAIIVGIVAAGLLYNYIQGIQNEADEKAVLVEVYSAKADIVRGTTGQQATADGSIAATSIPQEFRPATAITTLDEIQKKVAIFDIAQNTVIVQGMFVDPAQQQISFRARLKNPEHVAVSVSVDGVAAVGGFLVPGDEVNMMVSPPPTEGQPPSQLFSAPPKRYLYQKVQILAVGSNVLLAPGESTETAAATAGGGSLTFNVPSVAAQYIVTAATQGGLYLTLVPEDYKPTPLGPLTDSQQYPAENGSELTPYGPEGNQD